MQYNLSRGEAISQKKLTIFHYFEVELYSAYSKVRNALDSFLFNTKRLSVHKNDETKASTSTDISATKRLSIKKILVIITLIPLK